MINKQKDLNTERLIGFEESIPRCDICIHKHKNNKNNGQLSCNKYKIKINKTSVCDDWKGHNGDTLE